MTRSPNPSGEPSGQTRPGRRAADRAAAGAPIVELHKQLAARGPAAYKPPSRAQRLKRVAISLLGVVLLFCAYDLLAVPLIEPTADLRTTDEASPDDLKYASEAAQRQREELSAWFGPGDWEVSAPMVFWLPKGLLVLKSYETRPDHSVKIEPCTLVFLPQGQFTDEANRRRRAIVLQAPSAILRFDSDMDPQHAKIGKLIGGNLEGVITVRSDQREPGPHDDLLLTTRDMELVGDRLTTPHPVEFRLGQSAGRGRNLAITLAPADPASAQRGLTFGGMRSLELADSVWMRVQPGRSDLFPAPALSRSQQEEAAQTIGGALAPSGTVQPPLEVQCEGAFRFDLEKYEATFERTVVVSRANANGPSDQLTCELLSLFFAAAGSPAAYSAASATPPPASPRKIGIPKLELARIVATGRPVIIRSPSRGAQARGQRLEYDVKEQSGSLSGSGTLQGMAPGEGGRNANGALAGVQGRGGSRPIDASWSEQLSFRPHEGNQVLSIIGDADVQMAETGRIRAGELHLWLVEQVDSTVGAASSARPRTRLVPARLLARRKTAPAADPDSKKLPDQSEPPAPSRRVEINSPQLTGEVGELQAWFDYAPGANPPHSPSHREPIAPRTTAMNPSLAAPLAPNAGVWLGNDDPAAGAPPTDFADAGDVPATRHYHVNGELVQLQVVVRGRTAEVTELDIEGGVRLDETQSARPGEAPLRVRGDHAHATQPRPNEGTVTVAGKPAHVEARGMTIEAGAINVDRGANRAWVKGPGAMSFPADRDLDGNPLAHPQRIELTWNGGMEFDGQRARFDRDVVARLEEQRLATASLTATFSQFVRFGEGDAGSRPEIERIDCDGGVYLERRGRDKAERLASIERLQTHDLSIQQRSGDMTAHGPGWVSSVRIDTGEGPPGLAGLARGPAARPRVERTAQAPGATEGTPGRENLVYLGVHFQGDIVGNQRKRVMIFQRQVRTVYGPVEDWEGRLDPNNFDSRRDRGVLMDSDRLQVAQLPAIRGQAPSYVLDASGNTTVDGNYEGANYWANAARITYEQAKDLLVLEGSGREPARLYRQTVVGGPRDTTESDRILFHPASNQVQFDRARSVEISDLGGLPRPRGREASGLQP